MPAPDRSHDAPSPLGPAITLVLLGALGLFLTELVPLFGMTPRRLVRSWWPEAGETFLGYAPGGNGWWRLFGWFLVVVVLLNWRTLLAGGIAALRLAIALFIAASLAYAFSGDTTLWRF